MDALDTLSMRFHFKGGVAEKRKAFVERWWGCLIWTGDIVGHLKDHDNVVQGFLSHWCLYLRRSFTLSCMHRSIQLKSLSCDRERWIIHLYSNTPSHVEALSSLRRGIGASNTYFI